MLQRSVCYRGQCEVEVRVQQRSVCFRGESATEVSVLQR